MKTRYFRIAPSVFSTLLILLVCGCVKPDYLPGLKTGTRYKDIPDPEESMVLPQAVQPQFMTEKIIKTPDSGTIDLAVEQAVQLALRNNRDLKIEQINPVIAGTFEAFERGVYDPQLFSELNVFKEERSEAGRTGVRTAVEEKNQTALIGLRQNLPTGTTFETSVEQKSTELTNEAKEQRMRIGLSVTQALLRGFGPTVNLVGIRQAEFNTAVSRHEFRGITEALLADTEIAYWDYVLAGRKNDIFERSLAIALQQLDEIQQRIEVGTLPRIEAAAAHAEVARRNQALIDVRSTFEQSRLRLLRLINSGKEGQLDLQIRASSKAETNPEPVTDLNDRLLLAMKSRPDLNEARLRLKQSRLETIATRNGLLPRLDLFISLGKTGYADSFSDALKDLDSHNHDFSAGLIFSHYLDDRQTRARDLAARASWRQARESVENLKQLIDLDVRLAVNEFERTRKQITATKATRLLQEETLKAEMERFDVGASTALLVAQAQRDLLASTIDEVEAIINCRQALVKLYLAEGSLLERRGVRLAESEFGNIQ